MRTYIVKGSLLSLILFLSLTATAKRINEATARMKAETFIQKQLGLTNEAKMRHVNTDALATQLTSMNDDGQPIYIFNREGGGYVIVSGDDRTFDILGYGYTGEIDPETMPANMKSWLATYYDAIANLDEWEAAIAPHTPTKVKATIKPSVITTWNQGDPYNRTVPYYTYTYGGRTYSEPAVTGCGATALAQMMYYHRYPDTVQADIPGYNGEFSLDLGTQSVTATYTVDPIAKGTPIDWDNMLPSYERGTTYTTTQANAVSRLMQYIGAGTKMQYGPESSVWNTDILPALVNTFGYKDAYIVYASSFDTYEEWVDRVYNEIVASEVISFNGTTANNEGHMFLLDGYEGEDYFHVNWGWGGYLDGYFKLALMDPGIHQGTGGSTAGYSFNQNFITGFGPNGKGMTRMEKKFEAISMTLGEESMTYTPNIYGEYRIPNFKVEFGNYNFDEVTSYPAIGIYDEKGELYLYIWFIKQLDYCVVGEPKNLTLYWSSWYTWTYITFPDIIDGKYTLMPICSLDGENWQPMYRADRATLYLTISNGTATISSSAPTAITAPQSQPQLSDDTWRTLDGRTLHSKPTIPGIYIRGKQKVLIK